MSPGTLIAWPVRNRRSGYTLVELLVVMAIIALLVSLLMTGLRGVMRQANSLVCMSNLRQIAFDFQRVAEDPSMLERWDPNSAGVSGFGLTSFIDKTYNAGKYFPGADEGASESVKEYYRGQETFLCPAGPSRIRVRGGRRMIEPFDPIDPDPDFIFFEDVSYGFNARLRKIFRFIPEESDEGDEDQEGEQSGEWVERYVKLSLNMYNWQNAPKTALVFDVDARAAVLARSNPHLIAPPNEPIIDNQGDSSFGYHPGEDSLGLIHGRKWFPSQRHQGKTNVALLDGSVRSVKDLLADSEQINWKDADYPGKWINGMYELPDGVSSEMTRSLWSETALSDEEVH